MGWFDRPQNDRKDVRFTREHLRVNHASSRGRVQLKGGKFVRGSQLIGHQVFMWLAGEKVPMLIWTRLFLLFYWIAIATRLEDNEWGLIMMRLYASAWGFLEHPAVAPVSVERAGFGTGPLCNDSAVSKQVVQWRHT